MVHWHDRNDKDTLEITGNFTFQQISNNKHNQCSWVSPHFAVLVLGKRFKNNKIKSIHGIGMCRAPQKGNHWEPFSTRMLLLSRTQLLHSNKVCCRYYLEDHSSNHNRFLNSQFLPFVTMYTLSNIQWIQIQYMWFISNRCQLSSMKYK